MARFVLNGGSWNGEQLLNEEYIKEATANLTANHPKASPDYNKQGYGYQFWQTGGGAFACIGMGGQTAVMVPEKDMILVTTADTQGAPAVDTSLTDLSTSSSKKREKRCPHPLYTTSFLHTAPRSVCPKPSAIPSR